MTTKLTRPEPIPPMAPEAIIRLREVLGWSQADLAQACAVTIDTIRRVEADRATRGTRQLVTRTLDRAADEAAVQPFPWERA